jgi:hypothetical protein
MFNKNLIKSFFKDKGKSLELGITKKNYKLLTTINLQHHQRSWRTWAESVENKNEKLFPAVKVVVHLS